MKLSNLGVGARLTIAFGVLIVIMLAVAVVGMRAAAQQLETMHKAVDVDMKFALHVLETRTALGNLRRYEKDLLLNLASHEKAAGYMNLWRARRTEAQEHLTAAQALAQTEAERLTLGQLDEVFKRYQSALEIVHAGVIAAEIGSAEEGYKTVAGFTDTVRAADRKLDEMHEAAVARTDAIKPLLAANERQRRITVGIGVVVVIVLASLIGWLMTRSIVRPLNEAVRIAEALARGDLTQRIESHSSNEVGRLMGALKGTVGQLAAIVGRIKQSSDMVGTASREIAQGNSDLSQRTEEQASALEETSASMQQMTATVGQNAQNAKKVNDLAAQASGVAAKGGEVVREAVGTMNGITAASKKIADIIGVIDGIAFQTNILALNAAVEAARAGEQGRGFAVVASEVRSLAQRSAAAAKEIKDLITDSVSKVDAGSRQVNDAGRTMEEIVSSVKKVTSLIAEITAASQEQAQGIEQVSETMTQLEKVTQQNAAMVEQASAAAGSLEEQSKALASAVAAFRLRDA